MNTFTDWISAYAAFITAFLTFGLLIAAGHAYYAARDTLAQMREDSAARRDDSARTTRPYVHARMVPSIAGLDTWDLVIQNTGKTAAHNLQLEIAPLNNASITVDSVTGPVLQFATASLSVHPGERIRSFWVLGAASSAPTGFPPSRVAVTYEDSEGNLYTERPVLFDPASIGQTPAPYTGAIRNGGSQAAQLRNIENALRAVAHNLGETNR
ncbi:hypothetical protein ACXET9_03730 [Brachybacterium sp. DNPG3]